MLTSGNGSQGSPVGEIVQTNFGPDLCSQPKQVIFEEEKKGRDSVFEFYFYCEMLESGNDGGGQMVRD